MSKRASFVLLTALCALACFGWYRAELQSTRLLAVSWGDSAYAKALYGAYVSYTPAGEGQLDVWLTIEIGRSTPLFRYQQGPILLGKAATPEEAVARWGKMEWSDQGLRVGDAYLLSRAELEAHR